MAMTGYFQNEFRRGYALRVEWVTNSQNIENNTSDVTFTVYLMSFGSSYYINSTASKTVGLSINGTAYYRTARNLANLSGGEKKALFSKTLTIPHNDDGTMSLQVAASFTLEVSLSGTWWGTVYAPASGFATVVLEDVPRPTTPVMDSVDLIMGTAAVISLPRKSEEFLHTLKISFGEVLQTLSEGIATSYTWKPSISDLAPQIPNAVSGAGVLICDTYKNGVLIGTRNVNVTLAVPESVKPTFGTVPITATETVSGVASKFNAFIKNISQIAINVSANGVYGSTIVAYKATLDGKTYNSNSFTSEKITSSGELIISATVTDSRGRTNTETLAITVLDYELPTISKFSIYRCDENGEDDPEGSRINFNYAFNIFPIDGMNDKQYEFRYRETGETSWNTLKTGSVYSFDGNYISEAVFDPDLTYEASLLITDYLASIGAVAEVPTAFTLMDLRHTGKGLAIGKVSEKDCLEIALDIDLTGELLQEEKQNPELLNGWTNYDEGYETLSFWKDKIGIVHVSGLIKSGETAAETVIFNLPTGYRPAYNEKFFGVSVNDICIFDVCSNGNVIIKSNVKPGWVSLSGITFKGE